MKDMDSDNLKKQSRINELEEQLKKLKGDNIDLKAKIKDLGIELKERNKIIQSKDDITIELRQECKTKDHTITELKSQLEKSKSQGDDFDQKMKDLEYKNKQLQSQLDETNDLKKIMKKKLKKKDKEIEKLKTQVTY